jgi:hypothetical protein
MAVFSRELFRQGCAISRFDLPYIADVTRFVPALNRVPSDRLFIDFQQPARRQVATLT